MSLSESRKAVNRNTRQRTEGCVIPEDILEANSDFFSLLNSDGVVQIGSNVIRIDYCNNSAYLISSTAAQDAAVYEDFLAALVAWITTTYGNREWRVEYNYRYVRKGRSEVSSSGTLYVPSGSNENKIEYTFYDGSRGLERYDIQWDVFNYTDNYKIFRQPYGYGVNYYGEFLASQPADVANYYWNVNVLLQPPVYYRYVSGY